MSLVGSSVAVSDYLTSAPLLTVQGVRYAIAALAFLCIARVARAELVWPRGAEWWWLAGVAINGLVLFNVAVVIGVDHAEPAVIAVALACAPVLVALIGPLLEGRMPHSRTVTASLVVAGGSILVAGFGAADGVGILWAAIALLCEAAFTVLAVPVLKQHGAFGVSTHAIWMAALGLLLLGAAFEGPTAATRLSSDQWLAILYIALIVTPIGFICWYYAVAGLGSSRAALLCGVAPVAAAFVGVLTTGHAPTVMVWVGIGVVFAGLAHGLDGNGRESPPGPSAPNHGHPAMAASCAPPTTHRGGQVVAHGFPGPKKAAPLNSDASAPHTPVPDKSATGSYMHRTARDV